MKFVLLRSNAFVRAARKILKKHPEVAPNIQSTLELLSIEPFHPRLRTHKLKGEFQDSYACSGGYDLRIIFKFVEHEAAQAILLESIGTHDEVY
ncbi:MAG: type II toxin-antitoxin system mRNA interferase toxin, RelE/StbE family [Pseudanabaena sp. CAN_BIN31]|nr:type II toxin-antitoxin system mRNA interferase toxin, RelE/StbE family [Pseudanabaena sp. CAN_BIN31]